jgi:CelD/BcsL family acetyltransferase involved in cellulose biosynthesis
VFVQRIDSASELSSLGADWDRLVERSGYALPFSTFAWSATWWRYFAEDRDTLRDHLSIRAVRDDNGELVGIAPLMITERPATGPLRARCLRFIGADPNITEVPGPVCMHGLQEPVYSALLADLRKSADEWDWILWSGLKSHDPAVQIIADYRPMKLIRETPAYILALPQTWEEFRSKLPRNIKESLRKCYNSLKRDGHEIVFSVTERVEDMPEIIDRFARLHEARACVTGTVRHPNVFPDERARSFLLDVCRSFAERRAVRVFALRIRDEVVAVRIGFVLGRSLYLYYSGYNPRWAKYSVMTTVIAESIKYAIASGLETINLSTGNDVSKTRWRPSEVAYQEAIQISPSIGARTTYAVYRSAVQMLGYRPLGDFVEHLFGHKRRG